MHTLSNLTLSIAGLYELPSYQDKNVRHVVSLIDPEEPTPPSIASMGADSHLLLRLNDVIDEHEDRRSPMVEDVARLIDHTDKIGQAPLDHLLVHCHMGRSRSTAAAAIMLYRLNADTPAAIFRHIASVRDPIWPNSRMLTIADDLLNTGGALLEGCRPIFRDVAERHKAWIAPWAHSSRMRDLDGMDEAAERPDVSIPDA